ncbi:MAG: hypothetical protein ACI9JN_000394 [Bacteroidia bacterium]|jgi:hypothetical protein
MKKRDYEKIRYVDLLAYWKILYQVCQTPKAKISDVVQTIKTSAAIGGDIPAKMGVQICVSEGSVLIDKNSFVELSARGRHTIEEHLSDEPSTTTLRGVVRKMLLKNKFTWLVFYTKGPVLFKMSIPNNWEVILENCGLLDFDDPDIRKWWHLLFSKYNKDRQERNKAIGDAGEYLTFEFEKSRVSKDGFDPHMVVGWASTLDDHYGYDILSICGNYHTGNNDEIISIEVKSSENTNKENFRFHLSRNEWNTALKEPDSFYFYCWLGVKIDGPQGIGPFSFPAREIINKVPIDQDTFIEWADCRVSIDLNTLDMIELG